MKKAIIIHGYYPKTVLFKSAGPTPSNDHWIPWLSKQLYVNEILPIAIEMPAPWRPVYEDWKRELERFELNESTILVGHSYGGGFLARYLSENNVKVGKVFLVAPYLGANTDRGGAPEQAPSFFQFDIDKNLAAKTNGVTVFASTNDMQNIKDSLEILKKSVANLGVKIIPNADHFRNRDEYAEFPELLEGILR
jgi:predicted alpha/beta hydrolase family esterase